MKLSLNKFIHFLLIIYVLSTILFPQAIINKLIFILIIVIGFTRRQYGISLINAPIYILLIFLYGLLISFVTYSDHSLALSFFLSASTLILIYPVIGFQIDLDQIIKRCGIVFAVVDFVFILYGANKYSMNLPFGLNSLSMLLQKLVPQSFFLLLEKYCEPAIGYRGFLGGFDVMVHLGTIPFIFLPFCLWFKELVTEKKKRNIFFLILSLFDIVCCASRALLLVSGAVALYIYIISNYNVTKRFIKFLAVGIICIISLLYIVQNTSMFSTKEVSNSIKIGHITSAFSSMDMLQFVFGKGLASFYFSSGINREIAHTEITLLDYYRYFGFILGNIVYYKLLVPVKFLVYKKGRHSVDYSTSLAIFVGYLAISLTNPVLMNTMGIIVIIWYWNNVYRFTYVE